MGLATAAADSVRELLGHARRRPASAARLVLGALGRLLCWVPRVWIVWFASRLSHFRKNWYLWAVLFYATNMKSFVNDLEGSFARSLAVCEVRCEPGVYSGSKWCGDRSAVLESGARLSAYGVGVEDFATKCALFLFFLVSGVWGPRPCLLIGFSAIGASCALFAISCSLPELGVELYVAAQCVQGLNPAFYLQSLVTMYICCQPDGDWRINAELGMAMMLLSIRVRHFTFLFLEVLELVDFRAVWWSISLLNFAILALTRRQFPSITLVSRHVPEGSVFWKLACEAWSYRSVVLDWRLRRYVFRDFLDGFCHPIRYYMDLQMIRHHGWSEPGVGAVLFLASYTKLFATPLYWKGVEWYGHYNTYMFVFRAIYFLWMFGFLLGPVSDKSIVIVHYLLALMEGGFGAEKHFLDARFADWDGLLRAGNVVWIMFLFQASWSFPLYDALFHSASTAYWSRARFVFLHSGVCIARYLYYLHAFFNVDGVRGFGVTLQALDSAKAKAADLWRELAGAEGIICAVKYELCELDRHIDLLFAAAGGPLKNQAQLQAATLGLLGTPERDQEALCRLDAALACARKVPALLASCPAALSEAQAAHWWWPRDEAPQLVQAGAPTGLEEWSSRSALRAARLRRPHGASRPELEGIWLPAWRDNWTYPHQAWDARTARQFDRFGRATFFYGPDGEYGTISAARFSDEGHYALSMQVKGGHFVEGAQLDDMIMRLQPDGSMTVVSSGDGSTTAPPIFEYWARSERPPDTGADADFLFAPVPDSPLDTPEGSDAEGDAPANLLEGASPGGLRRRLVRAGERLAPLQLGEAGDAASAAGAGQAPNGFKHHPQPAAQGPLEVAPDLEGSWFPARADAWSRPHQGKHALTSLRFEGGAATFCYGPEGEHGSIRVTGRSGSGYIVSMTVGCGTRSSKYEGIDLCLEADGVLKMRTPCGGHVEFWARVPPTREQAADAPAPSPEAPEPFAAASPEPLAPVPVEQPAAAEPPAAQPPPAVPLAAEPPEAGPAPADLLAAGPPPAGPLAAAEGPPAEPLAAEQTAAEPPAPVVEPPSAELPAAESPAPAAEPPPGELPAAVPPALAGLPAQGPPGAEPQAPELLAAGPSPAGPAVATEGPPAELVAAEQPAPAELVAADLPPVEPMEPSAPIGPLTAGLESVEPRAAEQATFVGPAAELPPAEPPAAHLLAPTAPAATETLPVETAADEAEGAPREPAADGGQPATPGPYGGESVAAEAAVPDACVLDGT